MVDPRQPGRADQQRGGGEPRVVLLDCLRLYFGSTRPGVEGVGDIFVATRPQPGWTESAGRLA